MKKNLFKILCGALCACLIFSGLTACASTSWGGTTMTDWGQTNGEYARAGFVAETEKYLYYINGVPTSTDNNAFGAPVKGALMAVDKTDLTSKTEVVVPKLFASKNYGQGLFISGDYVYYGTPSTDKTSTGTVANSEMTFMRTKLDGTDTTVFFTVDSLSTEYRFVEDNGVVYILYFGTNSINSYNTETKENKEIVVTDDTVQVETPVNGEHGESLADKYFVGDLIVYTVTVYNERYIEEKHESGETARTTASYNKVYVYGAGYEEPVLNDNLDGREDDSSFKVDGVFGDYVLYTQTKNTVSTTYFVSVNELANARSADEKVNANYNGSDVTKIIDGERVYILDSGKVYTDSIYNAQSSKQLIADCSTISTMLFVKDGELYYLNASTQIAKIELNNQDAHEVVLTENTVVTTWYDPAIIELNQKEYLFYADSSSYGLSYVKYVELDDANILPEDTDDDDEYDKWYIPEEKATILGCVSDKDLGSIMTAKINALANELNSGKIVFDTYEEGENKGEIKLTDGKLTWKAAADVRAEYEGLSAGVKANVSSASLEALAKYERAIEMASLYYKLDGIAEYANGDDTNEAALQQAYEEIKDAVIEFRSSDDYTTISNYFDGELNLLWNFQKAEDLFEPEEEA